MKLSSLLLIFLPFLSIQPAPSATHSIALIHVTVIDATGAPAKPDMTVVVSGGHLAELGKDCRSSSRPRCPDHRRHRQVSLAARLEGLRHSTALSSPGKFLA